MQTEKNLYKLIQSLPNAAYSCDVAGNVQLYNEAAVQLWGKKPMPGLQKWCGSWQLLYPDGTIMRPENCPMAKSIKEERASFGEEVIVLREDGSKQHVTCFPTLLYNEAGTLTGALNIYIAAKHADESGSNLFNTSHSGEMSFNQATERFEMLATATSDTVWEWNLVNDTVNFNEGILRVFGYPGRSYQQPLNFWKQIVHPFDWKKLSAAFNDVFDRRAPYLQLSFRVKCADDSYKNVYARAFLLYNVDGSPMRMIGAMQDVTYLRQEENRIMKATIDAQENERQQIGFELHDNINQILTGCLLNLCTIKHVAAERTNELVDLSREYILTAIDEIRKLSHRLAPAHLDKLTLRESFEGLIRFMNIGNQFAVTMSFGNFRRQSISNEAQLNLYRILQEQLTNIVKYSKATAIDLSVTLKDGNIKMKISDNGVGFDVSAVKFGIGMNSMKRRTQVLQGTFKIQAAVGQGCSLIVEIPVQHTAHFAMPLSA